MQNYASFHLMEILQNKPNVFKFMTAVWKWISQDDFTESWVCAEMTSQKEIISSL